ncbi:MAG: hypothetical protein NTV33_03630 [Coprothermobacterota bacterium]|nr:hypothetical protein [Coprothermobacterota bacterium]
MTIPRPLPGTVGFPGTAAPQCGISSDQTEANRSGEQPVRGLHSRGYLPHFDTEHPAGGCSDTARWNHENRSRTGAPQSQEERNTQGCRSGAPQSQEECCTGTMARSIMASCRRHAAAGWVQTAWFRQPRQRPRGAGTFKNLKTIIAIITGELD